MHLLTSFRPARTTVAVPALTAVAVALAGTLLAAPAQAAQATPAQAAATPRPSASVASAVARAVAVPTVPASLPAGLEDLARYVPADSCDPRAKPGTTALGDLLVATYPGTRYGIDRTCGTDPLPTSEHYDGRALDFSLRVRDTREKAQAGALLGWLFAKDAAGRRYANARRLGVMYVIWNNRIWGSYRAADGWRAYSTCAAHPARSYDTTCHRDHIHLSLSWEGAMRRTSYWSGQVAAPDYGPCRVAGLNWAAPYARPRATECLSLPRVSAPAGASALVRTLTTYSGMVLRRGDQGPVVRAVQQVVGTTADGSFGPNTQAAVATWQTAHGVRRTGVVTASTWRAVLRTTRTSPPAGTPVRKPTHPELSRYLSRTLRVGSHGPAVAALQRRLHLQPAGGSYGRRTKARVRVFQGRHHLPATGVVALRTWRALGA